MSGTFRVKMLKNRGAKVMGRCHHDSNRYVPPNGTLAVIEAARILGTYPIKLKRLIALKLVRGRRVLKRGQHEFRITLSEVRRIAGQRRTLLGDRRKVGRSGGESR
jgi:hypothetical protein